MAGLSGKQKFWILMSLILAGALLIAGFGYTGYKSLSGFLAADNSSASEFSDTGNLAVLEIAGVITESRDTLKKVRAIRDNPAVKAVVLRIDSPGGAVGPSQEIFEAVKAMRKTKTIYCSFGDLAASGGYYIASACEKIVANAGTLTGSIGVIMNFANLRGIYQWAHVDPYVIKAGRNKDIGSPNRPMTDDERKILQDLVDDVHLQFKEAVSEARGISLEKLEELADGRVFTGRQAKELGLVDELGGEDEAIRLAAEKAGIKGKPHIIRESNRKDRFSKWFESSSRYQDGGGVSALAGLARDLVPALQLKPGVPYLLPAYMFEAKQ